MTTELHSLLPRIQAIAQAAGREISRIYSTAFAVETKADNSPLTAADRAAHDTIAEALARLTPGIPLWSEESATIPWETRRHWSEFWLVDPLDGTREFIKRNGEFTVNIALVHEHTARCLAWCTRPCWAAITADVQAAPRNALTPASHRARYGCGNPQARPYA
jgi:3'(2'),5'-bisphosphate nucleotidase